MKATDYKFPQVACYAVNDDSKGGVADALNKADFTLRRHNRSVQSVVYAPDSLSSNSMKSNNPNSGFHEETIAKTLQATGVDPTKNQGGNVVVEPIYALQGNGIDRSETAGCNGCGWREDVCYTLNTIDRPATCYSQGSESTAPVSDKLKRKYIVRRLTPLECCRLQGFPDGWAIPDAKESMTEEETAFWQDVYKTHATANGKKIVTLRNADAVLKWYNGLHSDMNEYKMWGNGIALPCALFVMEGIAEVLAEQETELTKE